MMKEQIEQINRDIEAYREAIENAEGALAEAERELDALLTAEIPTEPFEPEEEINPEDEQNHKGEKKMEMENKMNSKVIVAGCACVVFSELTPDEIRRLMHLHPEALEMKDDDAVVFTIDIDDGPGSLRPDGATFSNVTSAEGKATITILIDPECEDPMGKVREHLDSPLQTLMEMEAHLVELLPNLAEEEKDLGTHFTWL